MGLEVITDDRSEVHRNWVSSTVVHALGVRIDHGMWILRVQALERGGVAVALTGPDGAVFEGRFPGEGRNRMRALQAALKGAVSTLA